MAAFDPDAYLAEKPFDPDAYLGQTKQSRTPIMGSLMSGALRGAGEIGSTIMRVLPNALGGDTAEESAQRRKSIGQAIDQLNEGLGVSAPLETAGKLGAEIAGTAGVGGVLARGASLIPGAATKAAPVIEVLRTGGMAAGSATGLGGAAARIAGGAGVGAGSAALINPSDAGMGAVIGGFTPGILQLAGKVGGAVYQAVKANKAGSGKMLANALGVSESELAQIAKALETAPESIVDGSKLTVAQALQQQGVKSPSAQMLERIVSQSAGGDKLLKQYAAQNEARLNALVNQGAETYQGAAKEEAVNLGNKLGAIIRTQAKDDQAAARAAWESLYPRASQEGIALQLPLDEMGAAMAPLGRGTVGAGADASMLIREAQNIGTQVLPEIKPLTQKAVGKSQTLEQAVRAAGGIRGTSGELRDLGMKQSGTTGLINNKSGKPLDLLAEEMHRRGFIPDNDPATLVDMLRNGGGRKVFANDATDNTFQMAMEKSAGDMPEASRITVPIPFDEFQRLRRSAGALGAKVGSREGGETEAAVLNKLSELLGQKVDRAASGNLLAGEVMSPEFASLYGNARDLTRKNAELYKSGNIASIIRKPVGQGYTLSGDEVTNKLWHGGAGLADDVANLRNVLSQENFDPAMNALRKFVLTDAASKTTASGQFGSSLPKYVESRMPGLKEALNPEQLDALTKVAKDIKNAEAAGNVAGLRGSATYANISRALDTGVLDSNTAKAFARAMSSKGVGGESLREWASNMMKQSKGTALADLLSDPKAAAAALKDAQYVKTLDAPSLNALRLVVSRGAPLIPPIQSNP
jgi:hypothetical protein